MLSNVTNQPKSTNYNIAFLPQAGIVFLESQI